MSDDAEPVLARWLTVPGRLLLIVTVVGAGALFYVCFIGSIGELPPGRYPILLWILPVGIGAALFFFGAASVFEKVGIRIYRKAKT